jgi:hypothetical protein
MEWVITVKLPALTIAATDLLGERGRTGSASERPHPAHWVRPSLLAGQSNSPARRLVPGDPPRERDHPAHLNEVPTSALDTWPATMWDALSGHP